MRLGHRIRQFWLSLRPSGKPVALDQVVEYLSPSQIHLFARLSPLEQRHALTVLRACQVIGHHEPALAQAALLHDVGKTQAHVRVWHRVLTVVLRAVWPGGLEFLARRQRAFFVMAHHGELGAELARAAGSDRLTCALIRDHHSPRNSNLDRTELDLLTVLQTADEDG